MTKGMANGVEVLLDGTRTDLITDRRDLPLIVDIGIFDDENDVVKVLTQRGREVIRVASPNVDFSVTGPQARLEQKTAASNGSKINITS